MVAARTDREVIAIAAVAANGVIGADGDIPWRIAEDWARFKRLTLGHALIMGRRTYDSIGRPLPGRHTVVLTRDADWWPAGVEESTAPRPGLAPATLDVATDLNQALALAADRDPSGPTFVAGGAEIYRLAWPQLSTLEITTVDRRPDGNVRFPAVSEREWRLAHREDREGYAFVRYERRASSVASEAPPEPQPG